MIFSLVVMIFSIYILYKYFYKKRIKWDLLAIALILGILFVFFLPKQIWHQYSFCDSEIVRVTSYGDYNENCLGSEIIIKSMIVDGRYYDIPPYIVSGNWNIKNNTAQWDNYNLDSGYSDSIEILLPAGYNRKLVFSSNVYRGIAYINYRDQLIKEDFFSDTIDTMHEKILEFDNGKNYSDTLLLVLQVITTFQMCIIFYFIISFINLFLKKFFINYSEKDFIIIILLGIFTLFALSTHSNSPWSYKVPWVDSDVFLYGGWAMHHGEKMYLDFWDHKGPYLYFIEWLGYAITNSWIGVWFIEFIFVYISLLVGYYLNRRYFNRFIASISVFWGYMYLIFYLGNGNYIETYTLPLIVISAMIFNNYFYKEKYQLGLKECIVLGGMFMIAFLLRPNSIAIWFVYCIGILIHTIFIKRYKNIMLYAVGFLGGIILAFFPIIVYMTWNGIWSEFYEAYIKFNFLYVANGGDRIKAIVYFVFNSVNGIFILAMIMLICNRKIKCYVELICFIAWYAISMIFVCMSGHTWGHYAIIMLPIYPIGIGVFIEICRLRLSILDKERYGYIVGVFVFIISVIVSHDNIRNSVMYKNSLYILKYSEYNDKEEKIICENIKSHTLENERISVYGNACKYYLLSERKSVSKYTYQIPICNFNNTIGEEYIKDISNTLPSAIVIADKDILNHSEINNVNKKLLEILYYNYYLEFDGEKSQLYYKK